MIIKITPPNAWETKPKIFLFLCSDINSAATASMELEDQVSSEDPQQHTMKLTSMLSYIAYTLTV